MSEKPVHEDPYPSRTAMEAAVELEVQYTLHLFLQTQTIGKIIQRAIDKAISQHENARAQADAMD